MANTIKDLLEKKNNGNQSEMARFVGVSPQAVQKWVNGESEPRGANLELAANFLGVSAAELKFGVQFKTHSVQESQRPAYIQPQEQLNENIRAVIDLMKSTDDRGMRTIRLAAEQALDDYLLSRSRLDHSPVSDEEAELLRSYRLANQEKKSLLLMSAAAALIDDDKKIGTGVQSVSTKA